MAAGAIASVCKCRTAERTVGFGVAGCECRVAFVGAEMTELVGVVGGRGGVVGCAADEGGEEGSQGGDAGQDYLRGFSVCC